MAKATAAGLLSFEEAAEELQTSVLAVKRIVARGRLKAHRLNKVGPQQLSPGARRRWTWRIKAGDLTAYVTSGARDLDPPKFKGDNWFENLTRQAVDFNQAVQAAASDQIPVEAPGVVLSGARRVELKMTSAIIDLAESPVPVLFGAKADPESPFRNWRELYLCQQVRTVARKLVEREPGTATPAAMSLPSGMKRLPGMATAPDKLYEDYESYERLTSAAVEQVLSRGLSFGQSYLVKDGHVGRWVKVSFVLPHKLLASPASSVMDRVVEVAF